MLEYLKSTDVKKVRFENEEFSLPFTDLEEMFKMERKIRLNSEDEKKFVSFNF